MKTRTMRKKCECGGTVKYVVDFGRRWSWCDTCTPVVTLSPSVVQPGERGDR